VGAVAEEPQSQRAGVAGATPAPLESLLHSFGSGTDGQTPYASLTLDSSGALYGTTYDGGANGTGTVFRIVP